MTWRNTWASPGEYPFTRGVYPTMYTTRPWTMRQYAGFGTAAESNARYHQLLAAGTTGLSVAFDLPTQMGYDSDAPIAHGEVGKVGVAIDSIEDMRVLFDGIPLDQVSTSMTINAPAACCCCSTSWSPRSRACRRRQLTGTIQNDILKEYIARGTYIFPPKPSLRLVADTFAYCRAEIPKWNTISISGYHMAEAGATPAQEIAFTLANGIEYVRAAIAAGLDVDDFAPRLSFFFVARTTLLEEVAKFRAARRIWARMMREEFGAKNPKSLMLRFHTQTAGVQLTAQQPEVNLVRVAVQALGGGARRHPVAAHQLLRRGDRAADREGGPAGAAHPAGARVRDRPDRDRRPVRRLVRRRGDDRRDREAAAVALMDRVEEYGSAVDAIEAGLPEARDRGVGVPDRPGDRLAASGSWSGSTGSRSTRRSRTSRCGSTRRSRRQQADAAGRAAGRAGPRGGRRRALAELKTAAEGTDNVLYPMKEALRARATVGEVCDALRDVWGRYEPRESF